MKVVNKKNKSILKISMPNTWYTRILGDFGDGGFGGAGADGGGSFLPH